MDRKLHTTTNKARGTQKTKGRMLQAILRILASQRSRAEKAPESKPGPADELEWHLKMMS